MDDYDKPAPRPFLSFGPGMRVWLLIALNFACVGLYQLFSKANNLNWLSASGPEDGFPVSYARIAIVISGIICFAVPSLVYANVFPQERFSFFRLGVKVKPLYLVVAALAMIIIVPGFDMVYAQIKQTIVNPDLKAMQDAGEQGSIWLEAMRNIGEFFVLLLVSALAPAVCEELFFRGCIQQVVGEWSGKQHIAVWVSALIFAMIHFNPAGFPVILVAGLMLGYAFQWTGSLRINILMHFAFNATSLTEEYIAQHNSSFRNWDPPMIYGIASLVLGLGLFALLFRLVILKKA